MERKYRVVILEDVATDAELAERELLKANIQFEARRVDNRDAFIREITAFDPDIILADHSLPSFDGLSALALARERRPDIPFIIVSGTLGEENAIEALKRGATDYVLKQRLSRLGPSVVRALAESADRFERRKAERSLKESLHFIEQVADSTPDIIFVLDLPEVSVSYMNRQVESILGYSRDEMKRLGPEIRELLHPKDRAQLKADVERLLASGQGRVVEIEHRIKDVGGVWRWLTVRCTVLSRLADGTAAQILGVAQDSTHRKRIENDLRESEEFNRAVLDSLTADIAVLDRDGVVIAMNKAWLGPREGPVNPLRSGVSLGVDYLEVCRNAQLGDDAREALAGISSVLEARKTHFSMEYRCSAPLETRWFFLHASPLAIPRGGAVISHLDITEMKNLEDQLRQAQKMEAVGRLAGGVAHDFNNLLTAILGYSQLVMSRMPADDPRRAEIEEIASAGRRASSLTSQLLAFSRRQVVEPRVVDLNELMSGMTRLLRRLVGEDIDLIQTLAAQPLMMKADPGQIEQVVMNLAVNSRDAMPGGGELIMQTSVSDLERDHSSPHSGLSGRFVTLTVSDTGIGMDSDVQARIFEPFYTTKEAGRGTGLGLSTVYGIVKQSGGVILVSSEPGAGTTFRIHFPMVEAEVSSADRERARPLPVGGSETILLVEDEGAVRRLASQVLRAGGYNVIEAQDSGEALMACGGGSDRIDLLIADVVMPGMGGPELAEEIKVLDPSARVLLMSGYSDHAVLNEYLVNADVAFLQKPFTPGTLLRKVRDTLDSATRSPEAQHIGSDE